MKNKVNVSSSAAVSVHASQSAFRAASAGALSPSNCVCMPFYDLEFPSDERSAAGSRIGSSNHAFCEGRDAKLVDLDLHNNATTAAAAAAADSLPFGTMHLLSSLHVHSLFLRGKKSNRRRRSSCLLKLGNVLRGAEKTGKTISFILFCFDTKNSETSSRPKIQQLYSHFLYSISA